MKKNDTLFFLLLIIFFLYPNFLQGQTTEGKVFLRYFSPRAYEAHAQNWNIVQDHRGIIYFGNTEGVLEYDGSEWNLIPVSNGSIVRALGFGKDSTLYVGAQNEFGYLKVNEGGAYEYVSLLPKAKKANIKEEIGDIWSIFTFQAKVYFFSFGKIIEWDGKKVKLIKTDPNLLLPINFKGRLYASNGKGGFSYWSPEKGIIPLEKSADFFKDKIIITACEYDPNHLLLVGREKLYIFNVSTEEVKELPLKSKEKDFLNKLSAYNIRKVSENLFAIASIRKGIIVFSKTGEVVQRINSESGLHTENAMYVMPDAQRNGFWAALYNGLAFIEMPTAIHYWNEENGLDGQITNLIKYENKLYAVSTVGVYLYNPQKNTFSKINETPLQCWKLINFKSIEGESKLLLASTQGLYEIVNDTYKPILQNYRVGTIYQSANNPNRVYLGTSSGAASVLYKKGQWIDEGAYKEVKKQIWSIGEDNEGNLWLATEYDGLLRLKANTDFNERVAKKPKKYALNKGLLDLEDIKMFQEDGKLIFATKDGIFEYDKEKDILTLSDVLGGEYKYQKRNTYTLAKKQNIVLAAGSKTSKNPIGIGFLESNDYKINYDLLKRIPPMNDPTLYISDINTIWVGGTEGLFKFDLRKKQAMQVKKEQFPILIRKIYLNDDSLFFAGNFVENGKLLSSQANNKIPIFPYEFNTITFHYSAIFFKASEENKYSYFLNGYDDDWSEWSRDNKKEYTNLFEGEYVFYVKAKNVYGQESIVAEYYFEINPPFYRSVIAYGIYVLLFFFLVGFIVQRQTRKLKKDKELLENVVLERTAEISQQKEELAVQAENMKSINREVQKINRDLYIKNDKIEDAYEDLKLLSEIGQQITTESSIEKINETVYQNVSKLMNSSAFGIGLFNEETQVLDFHNFIENNVLLPFHTESLDNIYSFSAWAFRHQQSIFINDIDEEYIKYIPEYKVPEVGEKPEALIYLPLVSYFSKKAIGVITVQSFEKNVYDDFHLDLLSNIANYATIAIENARAYLQINEQKKHLEETNDDLKASINYAQRIQQAMLPSEEEVSQYLPEYFIFFQPRDIVSGDFYFVAQKNYKTVVAAVDCTGHGIPGAFMSLIGNDLLYEIVNIRNITEPNKILDILREEVIRALRQEASNNQDGMDLAVCVIDQFPEELADVLGTPKIEYAGAGNPLIYIQDGELHNIRPNKIIIGGFRNYIKEDNFKKHTIEINRPTTFYIYSDGYQDQFGGERGRKFAPRRLRELFLQIHEKPMEEQKEIVKNTFEDWKGAGKDNKQIDDVLVIGVRVIP